MPKHKPIEDILRILRALSKEHPEQSIGSHIVMATYDTELELLSDKTFLEYLREYDSSLCSSVPTDDDAIFYEPENDEEDGD
jgi:hypothetical protein